MKALDFTEFTGDYEDVDGDKQTSTIKAAVVDDSTAYVTILNSEGDQVKRRREVTVRDGSARALLSGEVVVETGKPGVYDVLTAEQWASTAYGGSGPATPSTAPSAGSTPGTPESTPGAPAVSVPTD